MTAKWDGLNGPVVLRAEHVPVGQVNGESYGYKRRLRVAVNLRVERKARQETYETVNHEQVTGPLDFSITTCVWQPGLGDMVAWGPTVTPLRRLVTIAPGFDAGTVARLADLQRWHLNGMRAACAHMDEATLVREPDRYGGTRISTTANVCPVTGYLWGHAWLVEPLPASFLDDLNELLAGVDQSLIYREAS